MIGTEVTQVIFDDVYLDGEIAKGCVLVTEELLQRTRDLLSSVLPEDASDGMIEGFWEAVYDRL